jgi:hypothetical protein
MILAPRLPKPIHLIIEKYIQLTENRLAGLIGGFYIVGSIALDEFNERLSDIDFVAVLNRKAAFSEIEELRKIHQFIEKTYPRWKMSGSYVQASDLGKLGSDLAPHPHFHEGILHSDVQYELNSVTWWELKQHGIPVVGMESQNLPFTVNWDLLIAQMRANLNSYWRGWTRQPRRIVLLYSDWGIQWAVLGVLRQFYTFKENSITTKIRAGQYALNCLPQQWHRLVQEAIRIRQGKTDSYYRFRFGRMVEAVRFLDYIIKACNANSIP